MTESDSTVQDRAEDRSLADRIKQVAARSAVAVVAAAVDTNRRRYESSPVPEPAPQPERPEHFSWGRVFRTARTRIKEENVAFLSAGLAYYGILAIVPGLVAMVSLYGLVSDPNDVANLVQRLDGTVPAEVKVFLQGQITSIVESPAGGLTLSFVISVLAALWAASNGTKALIRGVNLAYGVDETRNPVLLRLLSVVLTLLLVAFVAGALAVVTQGSSWLGGSSWFNPILEYGRWPVLLGVVIVVLAGFYRFAPARREPSLKVAGVGAGAAALGWLAVSVGLSIYISRFGSFNETYGTLGAFIVVLLWLFSSAFVVLLGAVLDSSLEAVRRESAGTGAA